MSVALHDSRLFSNVEQADKFRQEQKNLFSDCSEKEQTVYIIPLSSGRKKRREKHTSF